MELFRTKNLATRISFPLITSGSTDYFTGTAWESLTNASISAYSWQDSQSATSLSISGTPVELNSTGLWHMPLSQSEMNPNSGNDDYIIIKFNASEIQEQSILIQLQEYNIKETSAVKNTTAEISAAVYETVIDTKSVEEILEILMAYSIGNISKSGTTFTYKKQDGTTTLFTITGTDSARTTS